MSVIPYPHNPYHVDNMTLLVWLERQGYEGIDNSLEESLLEYGLAWAKIPEALRDGDDDYIFIFSVADVEKNRFGRTGMCSSRFDSDFDWIKPADWDSFLSTMGANTKTEWMQQDYPQRIFDIYNYWGRMNVFGTDPGAIFKIKINDTDV